MFLTIPAQDITNKSQTVKCGYMVKQGMKFKNWKKRFFVLHSSVLYYYQDEKSDRPIAGIYLPGAEVYDADAETKKKNSLKIITPSRDWYVFCTTPEERAEWKTALESVPSSVTALKADSSCSGWMTKQGQKRKNWKRRYFILQYSHLYYFAGENDPISKGGIDLYNSQVERWAERPFGIKIKRRHRTYFIIAENADDHDRWMRCLFAACRKNSVFYKPEPPASVESGATAAASTSVKPKVEPLERPASDSEPEEETTPEASSPQRQPRKMRTRSDSQMIRIANNRKSKMSVRLSDSAADDLYEVVNQDKQKAAQQQPQQTEQPQEEQKEEQQDEQKAEQQTESATANDSAVDDKKADGDDATSADSPKSNNDNDKAPAPAPAPAPAAATTTTSEPAPANNSDDAPVPVIRLPTDNSKFVCAHCAGPISEEDDTWIETLAKMYHAQCFLCSRCNKSLINEDGGKFLVINRTMPVCVECGTAIKKSKLSNQ